MHEIPWPSLVTRSAATQAVESMRWGKSKRLLGLVGAALEYGLPNCIFVFGDAGIGYQHRFLGGFYERRCQEGKRF